MSITAIPATQPSFFRIQLLWIGASAAGGAIAGALEAGRFQFLATLVLMGFLVGIAQGLVLQHYLWGAWPPTSVRRHGRTLGWIAATGIGMVLGNLGQISLQPIGKIATLLQQQIGLWEVFWLNSLIWPIVLFTTSLLQWLLLRFQQKRAAGVGWWIPLSIVGGLLYGAVGATFCNLSCDAMTRTWNPQISTALTYAVSWAAYAVGTGWFIARLVRHNERVARTR